jgi:hypothetical protein
LLSALVAISRSRLLVWWWLAHGEVEGQLVGAAIGQLDPLAAVWAHQVGGPRTAAKGLDDLLLLGRHLFHPSPTGFDLHTLRRLASTISQTTWGALPLGRSAGSSPRRSHRILVLQPRSCSWRSISPRTSLGGLSSPRLSSARLARASTRSIRWFCTRFSRSCGPGDEVQPSLLGCARPGQQFPGDCLRLLADLDPDSIDHALQVGLQPPALPGPPPAPCRAAPTPRGSGISTGQLLPILGVSRVAGCSNRYLPRSSPSLSLSLVLDRYSLSLVQPSGADPPRSAGRPHVPPCRAAPTSMTCPSSASRGWSVATAGALGRARVADWLV